MNHIILYIASLISLSITVFLFYIAVIATRKLNKTTLISLSENSNSDFDISINQLAIIEKGSNNLKTVLVAANIVEAPEGLLREAVELNFSKGVHYIFLISKSNYDNFRNTYYKIFEVYRDMKSSDVNLLKLYPLEIEWGDRPYIFYETAGSDNSKSIYGFVGQNINKGIASFYTQLPKHLSYTLYNAIIAASIVELHIEAKIEEFKEEIPKVININSKLA